MFTFWLFLYPSVCCHSFTKHCIDNQSPWPYIINKNKTKTPQLWIKLFNFVFFASYSFLYVFLIIVVMYKNLFIKRLNNLSSLVEFCERRNWTSILINFSHHLANVSMFTSLKKAKQKADLICISFLVVLK